MEQLKLAWVYRFWIIVGIVALMPIISYFVDTRKLASNAQVRAGALKGIVSNLETAAKGPNPNEKWVDAVDALRKTLDDQVGVAWVDLYKKQVEFMTWPEPVKEAYVTAGEKGDVDLSAKNKYQEIYRDQFIELLKIVEPVDQKGKGLVQMKQEVIGRYVQPWSAESQYSVTVPEAWLAQEDIWLLRALLGVVARANTGSTKFQESAVKGIMDIRIGSSAVDETISRSKSAKEQLSPRGDGPVTGTTKADAREIKGGQLYRQIPVQMILIVDQPRLLQVLAEFGNSEIPMQVKQVEFSEIPIAERNAARLAALFGEAAKKGDVTQKLGAAPAKDDEFFQMAEVTVWARAILYNKPPKVDQEEKEAAAKAAAETAKTKPAEQPSTSAAPTGGANQ